MTLNRNILLDAAYRLDPVAWLVACAGFGCDEWQARFVRAAACGRNVAVAAARQSGKSAATAAFAAWAAALAWRGPSTTVLVSAPSLRQASEFQRRARELLVRVLPPRDFDGDNALEVRLRSGPRIISVPAGHSARGYSADAVVCEEAAFQSDDDIDAISATVGAKGGILAMISTPRGPVGRFADAVLRPGTGWHVERVRWQACSRLALDFVNERRRLMKASAFRTEYEASFEVDEGQVFERNALKVLLADGGHAHDDTINHHDPRRIAVAAA